MNEKATENRRLLTTEEMQECARLKTIFESRKKELGLTQTSIGDELGITQATMNQYFNGRRALNLNVAKTCAKLLRVDIGEFSPRLKRQALEIASVATADQKNGSLALIDLETPHKVMVHSFAQIINNNKGQGREMYYSGEMSPNTVFLRVETDQMQGLNGLYAPRNSTLKIEQGERPTPGDTTVYNLNGSPAIGEFSLIGDKPHVRPSNPQYPLIDVSDGELIGVVYQVITDAKQKH